MNTWLSFIWQETKDVIFLGNKVFIGLWKASNSNMCNWGEQRRNDSQDGVVVVVKASLGRTYFISLGFHFGQVSPCRRAPIQNFSGREIFLLKSLPPGKEPRAACCLLLLKPIPWNHDREIQPSDPSEVLQVGLKWDCKNNEAKSWSKTQTLRQNWPLFQLNVWEPISQNRAVLPYRTWGVENAGHLTESAWTNICPNRIKTDWVMIEFLTTFYRYHSLSLPSYLKLR